MVWMDMFVLGTSRTIKVSHRINSRGYVDILEEHLPQIRRKLVPEKIIFQHNYASANIEKLTKTWFQTSGIEVVEW